MQGLVNMKILFSAILFLTPGSSQALVMEPNLTQGCKGENCVAGVGSSYQQGTPEANGKTTQIDDNCCEGHQSPVALNEETNPTTTLTTPATGATGQ